MDEEAQAWIDAAEQNYLAAWRLLVSRADRAEVHDTDELLLTFVPDSIPFFNSAFVKPPAAPASCLESAESFFGGRTTDFTLRFRDSAEVTAQSLGLSPADLSPLMSVSIPDISGSSQVVVRRADPGTWDDHIETIAAGFALPVELANRLFGPWLCDTNEYAAFNAYVDGEVVSTAALIVSGDVAGIYNVSTPQRFRCRGFGEATTRAAASEGKRRGCRIATLQASAMGYPIYERMGFTTVVGWRSLTSP